MNNLEIKYGDVNTDISKEDYYEFTNVEEAEKWGFDKFKKWTDVYKNVIHMTSQYKEDSILHIQDPADLYFGYTYRELNEFLRTGEKIDISPSHQRIISNLVMAIYSAPIIGKKIVLYRQVSRKMIKEMIANNRIKDSLPYHEKGFMSTCLLKECCATNCGNHKYMLKMYVDDQTPIHAIFANLIRRRAEEELLLQPGLYMRMIDYPYLDEETGKTIIEVHTFSMFL